MKKKLHIKIFLAIILICFSQIIFFKYKNYSEKMNYEKNILNDYQAYSDALENQDDELLKILENDHKDILEEIKNNNNSHLNIEQIKQDQKDILDLDYKVEYNSDWEIINLENIFDVTKINLYSDDSITKFVSNKVSFVKKDYIPEDLVDLKWKHIIDTKWYQQVRQVMLDSLEKLSLDFFAEFQADLKVVSAYRSYVYQKWIIDRWCSPEFCSMPWFSEHQSGLAVDFFEATSESEFLSKPDLKKYFEWLEKNAHKYWFHNSYQNWAEIDWYNIEPWHWRYIWVEMATYLKNKDITFTQYYKSIN